MTQRHSEVPSPNAALTLSNVSAAYGGEPVLEDVSLSLGAGEILALIGPNGAGKSTLFKAVCGRLALASGSILIDGRPADQRGARFCLGVAPQNTALYDSLTAAENLINFACQMGMSRHHAFERAETVLRLTGLEDVRHVSARCLSGGLRQRVNIGAAVMHRPKLVLLDEPCASLDPEASDQIDQLVRRLAREGFAVLLVTHDMAQAEHLADRVAILVKGRLRRVGTPRDLIRDSFGQRILLTLKTEHPRLADDRGFSPVRDQSGLFRKALDFEPDEADIIPEWIAGEIAAVMAAGGTPECLDIARPGLAEVMALETGGLATADHAASPVAREAAHKALEAEADTGATPQSEAADGTVVPFPPPVQKGPAP